jgi:hypothetical protein
MSASSKVRRNVDWLVLTGLFMGGFVALWATEAPVGFVRDESVYFAAARSYAIWLLQLFRDPTAALTDAAIVRAFDFNHEHPALMKMLFGVSDLVLHQHLRWLRPATALRFPAFAVAALIPPLLYRFATPLYGRLAGLFAALSFFLVPRQFFNAHLACFDVPIATFWLLTVYFFWKAQQAPRYWLWCGVSFGLAVATKHNGWFLPFVLTPFGVWRAWSVTRGDQTGRGWLLALLGLWTATSVLGVVLWISTAPRRVVDSVAVLSPATAVALILIGGTIWMMIQLRRTSLPAFRAMAPLCAMAFIGPALFYLLWPYLWHHPIERAAWYFDFHATHVHYAWFYLGRVLRAPPFPLEYVFVKTALTVPVSILLPMALGLLSVLVGGFFPNRVGSSFVADRRWDHLLVAANALASIVIISHPDVPHFGGVKHWLPSMCFLGLLGGFSVSRAALTLGGFFPQGWARNIGSPALLFSALLSPALVAEARIHPYGTSYYSELAGGVPGAATIGMQRQFWSNNVTGVLPWINSNAPAGSRLWLHEVTGLAFREYQLNGMLRADIRAAQSPKDANLSAYQYHQEFREQEFEIWQEFGTQTPATGLYLDETPQVIVYQRR